MNGDKLTLREALASDRLEDFIGQEVTEGSELLKGSELASIGVARHAAPLGEGRDFSLFVLAAS
jgi:hypothetical protein